MAICEPSGQFQWAKTSSSMNYGWGAIGYFLAFFRARRVAQAGQPAAITAAKTAVCAFNPAGCSCNTSEAGPFENSSSTGWLSGTVTVTISTQVKGTYVCDTVPEGAVEYKVIALTVMDLM